MQEWGPEPQRGWNFVAWSLSMEWLAYLIFPLLVLLLFGLFLLKAQMIPVDRKAGMRALIRMTELARES